MVFQSSNLDATETTQTNRSTREKVHVPVGKFLSLKVSQGIIIV